MDGEDDDDDVFGFGFGSFGNKITWMLMRRMKKIHSFVRSFASPSFSGSFPVASFLVLARVTRPCVLSHACMGALGLGILNPI